MFEKIVRDVFTNRGRKVRAALRRRLGLAPAGGAYDHVYSVDFGRAGAEMLAEIEARLRSDSVPLILGGQRSPMSRRINVRDVDLVAVLDQALRIAEPGAVIVRRPRRWRRPLNERLVAELADDPVSIDLLVYEDVVATSGEDGVGVPIGASRIEVVLWREHIGPYDAPYLESSRSNTVAARLRVATFDTLAVERHEFGSRIPPADLPQFPIDVVYTWVDGDDPKWLASKDATQSAITGRTVEARVLHDERFRNRDELKYSLRSIELFAPWVRRIHIVTAGQRPEWLNVDHPRLHLVDHEEIYADPDWLPTFNSSGIETQLHRVPGLADKFLYFNDDFFLGQTCDPGDFFYGNGVLKYFPSAQMAYEADIDASSEEYIQADRNAIELIAGEFGAVNRQIMAHAPYASDRQLLFELEERFPAAFRQCASSPFRSGRDLRPIVFMQYHYGFHRRMAHESSISHRYLALWKPTVIEQMANVARRRRYKTFCINDVGLQPERTALVNDAVVDFLEGYFPRPSSFER